MSAPIPLGTLQDRLVKALQNQKGRLISAINREREKLNRMEDKLRVPQEMYNLELQRLSARFEKAAVELHDLVSLLVQQKGLSKKHRRALRAFEDLVAFDALDGPERGAEDTLNSPHENLALRPHYLRLARRFHPDKAESDDVRPRYTAIMQEINRFYSNNDEAALLSLDDTKTVEVSDVERLYEANELLVQQRKRLAAALSALEVSPLKRIAEEVSSTDQLQMRITNMLQAEASEVGSLEELCHTLKQIDLGQLSIEDLFDGPLPGANDPGLLLAVDDFVEVVIDSERAEKRRNRRRKKDAMEKEARRARIANKKP